MRMEPPAGSASGGRELLRAQQVSGHNRKTYFLIYEAEEPGSHISFVK